MASLSNSFSDTIQWLGKIQKDIYQCVTPEIVTDDVVITTKQVQHIQERHPNDYAYYALCMVETFSNPQYILEANRPYTAMILKEFSENSVCIELVLRLAVKADPPGYCNSVITFLKVGKKRFDRYLRTKKILYKSELL